MPRPAIRRIKGLIQVARCPSRPLPRPTTVAQRYGLAYQRKVGKALIQTGGRLEAEPWFSFFDENGRGQAVPDFTLILNKNLFVIEVKVTYTDEAYHKLLYLYLPLIRCLHTLPIRPLIICKNLTPDVKSNSIVSTLANALNSTAKVPVLQWLGRGHIP